MKVILLEDVKSQGKKGEVVDVNEGYARNCLIKKNLAAPATQSVLNELEQKKAAEARHKQAEKKAAEELMNRLNGITVKVKVKSGESGKLFGSVTTKEIADALNEIGYAVDKKMIMIKEPVKSIGRVMIDVKVYAEMTARINLVVEAL
jgi:large subunit ribosomal protein L9